MSDNPRTRANLYAGLALLAAFVLGGAGGYALGRRQEPQRMKQMTLLGVSRAELLDSLDVTAEQRLRIEAALDEAQHSAELSISLMMTQFRDASAAARDSVRAALDSAQRLRLDSLLQRARPLRPRSPLPQRTPNP